MLLGCISTNQSARSFNNKITTEYVQVQLHLLNLHINQTRKRVETERYQLQSRNMEQGPMQKCTKPLKIRDKLGLRRNKERRRKKEPVLPLRLLQLHKADEKP